MPRRNAIIWKDFYKQNKFCEHITLENGEKISRFLESSNDNSSFRWICELCNDKSIIVNPTSLSVVDQLGASATREFTLTNTTSQDFTFSIKEATPAGRSISLVEITDDSKSKTCTRSSQL